jgi:adenylosuccinate lyase
MSRARDWRRAGALNWIRSALALIDRYTTPAMAAIWGRESKYKRWLEVELAISESHAKAGTIPAADWRTIQDKAAFKIARCDEIEKETRHDLVAFVRNLEESVGAAGRWIHFGVTSYDVIDTALGMMLRDSCGELLESISNLKAQIAKLNQNHGKAPMIGRTHGIHAEPITFGFKLAGWMGELNRSEERIQRCREEVAVGKVSGAVGVHAHVSSEMEAEICTKLGLRADPASTQIVARDRLAHLFGVLAVLAGSLERIATELRNLQRTEIAEVQEEFGSGQTGSSAMPHKRNPWNSETVSGLAKVVRGNTLAVLESLATWHERDLTNSSLERIVLPDTFHLVDFMLRRLTDILSRLKVFPDKMAANLRLTGDLVFSEHLMVALIKAGMSRSEAYAVAQRNAAKAHAGADFKKEVEKDPDVKSRLNAKQLEEVFDLKHHLRNAGEAWDRVTACDEKRQAK